MTRVEAIKNFRRNTRHYVQGQQMTVTNSLALELMKAGKVRMIQTDSDTVKALKEAKAREYFNKVEKRSKTNKSK